MVNAIPHKLIKRTTDFIQCPPPEGSTTKVPLLKVSLSADPPVAGQKDTFTVSGKLLKDATEQTKLGVAFVDLNGNTIGDLTVVSACSGSGCKIKAGDQYTQTVDVQVPNNLTKL
ncbi:11214_t:CDS:2 [Funneliformis mosseae]|uniref:Phosphatidylglycerol/phosphatidylinositol transfer protein n=1 Tax=Funneliformis mosseae TaxID=27381 RepID=A0A9N9D4G3_FUNMO|nr:11214_t:CDS:2 [Funneliformis mosseae]